MIAKLNGVWFSLQVFILNSRAMVVILWYSAMASIQDSWHHTYIIFNLVVLVLLVQTPLRPYLRPYRHSSVIFGNKSHPKMTDMFKLSGVWLSLQISFHFCDFDNGCHLKWLTKWLPKDPSTWTAILNFSQVFNVFGCSIQSDLVWLHSYPL